MWSCPSYPELDPAPPTFDFGGKNAIKLKAEDGHFDLLQLSVGHESPPILQVNKCFGISYENGEDPQTYIQSWAASNEKQSGSPISPGEFRVDLLRLLFLERETEYCYDQGIRYKSPISTRLCDWLNQNYSVPPVFLGHLARGILGGTGHTGNALFRRFDSDGKLVGIEGFYCRLDVWFHHDLKTRASTYVIVDCPRPIRDRISSIATGNNPEKLLQPLLFDVLLADGVNWSLADRVDKCRDTLVGYEIHGKNPDSSSDIHTLHTLCRRWHVLSGNLSNLEERLQYLLKLQSEYYSASKVLHESLSRCISESGCGIEDSVIFLLSRTRAWRRWAENYNERTKIQINLVFNLSTQADNKINLEIARLTGSIAVDTQKDSSSMITMAAVTMFFLPGTFVSALFSMVFFNVDFNGPIGKEVFSVSNRLWYFAAVTVPLTLTVFAVWLAWRSLRIAKKDIFKGSSILQ
ncbi:hypothetical protein M422DRAFT_72539 [Sphaerobolus stellatus SS14]|uniref:Uncharacterized protein n=1 Tax=Sphaerobolus stellatus (strain SS14) TaxID=990650 RepID=A0A0C9T408_SPHS4|nr:hypothetical protein M422DRAFT_72539 [Sphaerobolus stellatus SS14]